MPTQTMQGSSEVVLSLLNDTLDRPQAEAGRLELEVLDFDLESLLDDTAAPPVARHTPRGTR